MQGAVLNSAVPYGSWGPEISFEEFPNYTPGKKITLRVEALASGFLLSIPCEGFQYTFSYRPQDGSITAINEIYVKEIYNEGRMYTQNIVVGKGVSSHSELWIYSTRLYTSHYLEAVL